MAVWGKSRRFMPPVAGKSLKMVLVIRVLDGKRVVKLEISSGRDNKAGNIKSSKQKPTSKLEIRLDELRKELASVNGGIFPHSVLSAQQITMLADQKPDSIEQASVKHFIYTNYIIILLSGRA
ncbi:hypothetical protein Ancab_015826 [Ancistrocladus abbreviatus]